MCAGSRCGHFKAVTRRKNGFSNAKDFEHSVLLCAFYYAPWWSFIIHQWNRSANLTSTSVVNSLHLFFGVVDVRPLIIVKLDEVWWRWTEAMRGCVKWFQNLQQMQNCWARICSLFCQLWSSKKQTRRAFSRPVLQWLARTRCTTSPLNSRNTGNSTKLLDWNTLRPRLNGPYPQPKLSTQLVLLFAPSVDQSSPVRWSELKQIAMWEWLQEFLAERRVRQEPFRNLVSLVGFRNLVPEILSFFSEGENCEMPAVSGAATSQSAPGMELTLANQWVS